MSGLQKNGADLDAVFDPYVQGTKPALTGIQNAGQDVRDRYAPIVFGTSAAATGIKVNGADLNTLFAAFGTASYAGPKAPGFDPGGYGNDRGGIHDIAANLTLTIRADGTWGLTKTVAGTITGTPLSGTWHTNPAAGVGAGARVRFTTGGPWRALSVDQSESVAAFATTGEGGPTYDSETKAFQISISKTDGTQQVDANTSITATASV